MNFIVTMKGHEFFMTSFTRKHSRCVMLIWPCLSVSESKNLWFSQCRTCNNLVLCNLCSIYLLQRGYGFISFILFPKTHFVHLLIGVFREYSAHIHCGAIILAVWKSKIYKERDLFFLSLRETHNLTFSIFTVEIKWITEWHEPWLR